MTERNLSMEQLAELFEIQTLGTVAAAFVFGDVPPTKSHWEMLRGQREITLRDLGEIEGLTGYNMQLTLTDREPKETQDD